MHSPLSPQVACDEHNKPSFFIYKKSNKDRYEFERERPRDIIIILFKLTTFSNWTLCALYFSIDISFDLNIGSY